MRWRPLSSDSFPSYDFRIFVFNRPLSAFEPWLKSNNNQRIYVFTMISVSSNRVVLVMIWCHENNMDNLWRCVQKQASHRCFWSVHSWSSMSVNVPLVPISLYLFACTIIGLIGNLLIVIVTIKSRYFLNSILKISQNSRHLRSTCNFLIAGCCLMDALVLPCHIPLVHSVFTGGWKDLIV